MKWMIGIVTITLLGWGYSFKRVCLTDRQLKLILTYYNPKLEEIEACYPRIIGKGHEIYQINGLIKKRLLKDLREWMDMDRETLLLSTRSGSFSMSYQADYTAHIIKNRIISVVFYINAFTGGAHGNDWFIPFNWDLEKGVELNFLMVFNLDLLDELKRLIWEVDRRGKRLIANQSDFFNPRFLPLIQFTPKGIKFLFQKYTVAPGCNGAFGIEIPYYLLQKYLLPEYRVLFK